MPPPAAVRDAFWIALLGEPGHVPAIGRETAFRDRTAAPGVRIVACRSREGSTRYVVHVGGAPTAVLQVVSRDGAAATIANAYTVPAHRRRGLASLLLAEARADFASVAHSPDLSPEGVAFATATG